MQVRQRDLHVRMATLHKVHKPATSLGKWAEQQASELGMVDSIGFDEACLLRLLRLDLAAVNGQPQCLSLAGWREAAVSQIAQLRQGERVEKCRE
ncbi:hypothetical protein D3C71_1671560 [compost metagenome]